MSKHILDISEFQNVSAYSSVKLIDGVIIRIGGTGYGSSHVVYSDSKFNVNYNGFKSIKLPVGGYWYAGAIDEAGVDKEVTLCSSLLTGKKFELPIYYDMEAPYQYSYLTKSTRMHLARLWLNKMKDLGYKVGVYMNIYWALNYVDIPLLGNDISVWIAQYNSELEYKGHADIWQYTSSDSLPGISGRVDMNKVLDEKWFDSLVSGNAKTDTNNSKPATKVEPKKSIDIVAQEVIDGKWGNGEDRISRIKAAGYSYTEVQNKVNAIIARKKAKVEPKKEVCSVNVPVIRKGDRGYAVITLQGALVAHGYSVGGSGCDGIFGDATFGAVKRFQTDKHIGVDGIVGQQTWTKLLGA